MRKIIYTIHALRRLKQRNISKLLVEGCVKKPDKLISEDDVKRVVKRLNEKVLVVIYRLVNDKIIIITAYITSKVKKYFK